MVIMSNRNLIKNICTKPQKLEKIRLLRKTTTMKMREALQPRTDVDCLNVTCVTRN